MGQITSFVQCPVHTEWGVYTLWKASMNNGTCCDCHTFRCFCVHIHFSVLCELGLMGPRIQRNQLFSSWDQRTPICFSVLHVFHHHNESLSTFPTNRLWVFNRCLFSYFQFTRLLFIFNVCFQCASGTLFSGIGICSDPVNCTCLCPCLPWFELIRQRSLQQRPNYADTLPKIVFLFVFAPFLKQTFRFIQQQTKST